MAIVGFPEPFFVKMIFFHQKNTLSLILIAELVVYCYFRESTEEPSDPESFSYFFSTF